MTTKVYATGISVACPICDLPMKLDPPDWEPKPVVFAYDDQSKFIHKRFFTCEKGHTVDSERVFANYTCRWVYSGVTIDDK